MFFTRYATKPTELYQAVDKHPKIKAIGSGIRHDIYANSIKRRSKKELDAYTEEVMTKHILSIKVAPEHALYLF
jgi:hypothetical protein